MVRRPQIAFWARLRPPITHSRNMDIAFNVCFGWTAVRLTTGIKAFSEVAHAFRFCIHSVLQGSIGGGVFHVEDKTMLGLGWIGMANVMTILGHP